MDDTFVLSAVGAFFVGGSVFGFLFYFRGVRLRQAQAVGFSDQIQGLQNQIQIEKDQKEVVQSRLHEVSLDHREAQTKVERLPHLEKTISDLQARLHMIVQDKAKIEEALRGQEKAFQEKQKLLEAAEEKLMHTFKSLSSEALAQNNRSFLNLAQASLEKFQESAQGNLKAREQAISNLVQPLKETLGHVQSKMGDLEKARQSAYDLLKHQIQDLTHSQKELRSETANLVKALRAPTVRGRWGEMQLRRVVEMAGLSSHCDFLEQVHISENGNVIRPDMLINLPGGKQIVVDAKAPLAAYLDALESTEDGSRKEHLTQHARQVRNHVKALGQKAYWDQLPTASTPEFVVLFLPGETFFSAALEQDPSLIELGIEKKVIITTPSSLIALLHAVAYGWRQEALAQNAETISKLGQELYKRLSDMGNHMGKLGNDLQLAVKSYNRTVGTLEKRVLPSARRFKDLEASSARDEILELSPVEEAPRDLQAAELTLNLKKNPPEAAE